ncbi:TonB-dependent siderophore receptor [Steroidobacter flavus]|uniref:TonB-dependent siderophore receptor n=1 Tax=Steroidobacter flavus TaxID=1842136 RepID=A0ABV8SXR7_9GAMM
MVLRDRDTWRFSTAIGGVLCALVVSVSSISFAEAAQAEAAVSNADSVNYAIPAGSLSGALMRFAEQSGIQLVYSSSLTGKLNSPGLSGRYAPRDALTKLLEGTGLVYRFTSSKNVTVEKASDANSTRVLSPVRVEGAGTNGVRGVNGSTDITATEGTRSYTSDALSIASKTAQSIKDTPQSVSVITQQRIQDQNLTDFRSLMDQATGVSVVTGVGSSLDGPLTPTYFSRGFAIERLQIDGGAPLNISNNSGSNSFALVPQIDMGVYDHAEVLRGADGLFNGYGGPGGVISLVRKRPLDQPKVVTELMAGSWSNYRTMIDASAPLGFDGKLRGRGVLVYQDQEYFYDIASMNKTVAYGILEYDLGERTLLAVGFNSTRQDAVPFIRGLPRWQNGEDLHLPRDTCLCTPWNRYDFDTKDVFARVEHAMGETWNLKLNLGKVRQERSQKYAHTAGLINPLTSTGAVLQTSIGARASAQKTADLTLTGGFTLFGQDQNVVLGFNYSKVDGGGGKSFDSVTTTAPIDVFAFDPDVYPEPASPPPGSRWTSSGSTQWGGYTNLRLTVWEPLHISLGWRYSYSADGGETREDLCTSTTLCPNGKIGDVRNRVTYKPYKTHDFSWPPAWSLAYDITETLSAYGSYTDIYQSQANFVDPSGDPIGPVTGTNVEGGLKWAGRDGKLNATLSFYRMKQENFPLELIDHPLHNTTTDGIHRCCYSDEQDRTLFSQGLDLDVTGEVLSGLQISTGYTYNENENRGPASGALQGRALNTKLPRHLLKLWGSYQFAGTGWMHRLSVGGGVNAQSKGYYSGSVCIRYVTRPNGTVVCDTGGSVPYEFDQGAYAVVHVRAAYQLDPRWNLALNVNNLLDRTYYQTVANTIGGNWYGEPRSFALTIRGQFK